MKDKIDNALKKLYDEKKAADYKIQALRLAKKLLAEERSDRTLDRAAVPKTVEFVKSRKKPTTVNAVAKKFRISTGAASQRLLEAAKKGLIKRFKRGYYTGV